jgi:diacylglycerol kinase (ATP)
MKTIIINNICNRRTHELTKLLKVKYPSIEILTTEDPSGIPESLDYAIRNKVELLISSGGDGTLNHLINEIMKRKESVRNNLLLGVLPCGKANDMARELDIPGDLDRALKKIIFGVKKNIDLIKVNNKYFITGGGFGLPVEIIKEKDKISFSNYMGEKVYFYSVLKLFSSIYRGIDKLKANKRTMNNLMLYAIMNQSFVGKRFHLSPLAKNDDGYFDICVIKRGKSRLGDIIMLKKVMQKKHVRSNGVKVYRTKNISINFDKKEYFMADGELIDLSKKFNFSIMSKALTFLH